MTIVPAQQAVADYHAAVAAHGHDMHDFHAAWHFANRDPRYPPQPDADWGRNDPFGSAFLQMHHEMIDAADGEPKQFMTHQSVVAWYEAQGYDLPPEWDPLTPIPGNLAFDPADPALRRNTDDPQFALPGWFTRQGVPDGARGEPITGARKLADFANVNQLGCCIVYPHNEWHMAIGGAMMSFSTAIDDPVFYFGVHWHINRVFLEYRALRSLFTLRLRRPQPPADYSDDERRRLDAALDIGERLREQR